MGAIIDVGNVRREAEEWYTEPLIEPDDKRQYVVLWHRHHGSRVRLTTAWFGIHRNTLWRWAVAFENNRLLTTGVRGRRRARGRPSRLRPGIRDYAIDLWNERGWTRRRIARELERRGVKVSPSTLYRELGALYEIRYAEEEVRELANEVAVWLRDLGGGKTIDRDRDNDVHKRTAMMFGEQFTRDAMRRFTRVVKGRMQSGHPFRNTSDAFWRFVKTMAKQQGLWLVRDLQSEQQQIAEALELMEADRNAAGRATPKPARRRRRWRRRPPAP